MCVHTIGLPSEFPIEQELGWLQARSLNTAVVPLYVVYALGFNVPLPFGIWDSLLESSEFKGNPHLTYEETGSQGEEAASSRPHNQQNGRAF